MNMGYQNYFEQQIVLNPAYHAGMGWPSDVRVCNIQKGANGPQATQLQFEGDACPLLGPRHPRRMN